MKVSDWEGGSGTLRWRFNLFSNFYIWRFQNTDNSDLSWFQFLSIWDGDGVVIDTRYEVEAGPEDRLGLSHWWMKKLFSPSSLSIKLDHQKAKYGHEYENGDGGLGWIVDEWRIRPGSHQHNCIFWDIVKVHSDSVHYMVHGTFSIPRQS